MDILAIQEAAIRNRAKRLEMIAAVNPLGRLARGKIDALRAAKKGNKEARSNIETMDKFRNVPDFFPTPRAVIDQMLQFAGDIEGKKCLEPSAGKGNLVDALKASGADSIACYESNYGLAEYCQQRGISCEHEDFLSVNPDPSFDLVFMNPPFSRGIDQKHVLHAFEFLADGGTLVACVSSTTGRKLEEWAGNHGGHVEELPANSFKSSERSTGVSTALLVCYK